MDANANARLLPPQNCTSLRREILAVSGYFRLDDAVDTKGRWFLNGLRDRAGTLLDPRQFTSGRALAMPGPLSLKSRDSGLEVAAKEPLFVSLRRRGSCLDVTLADHDMPVVTESVGALIERLAPRDVQRIPIEVEGETQQYEIINIGRLVDAIDPLLSEIQWFEVGNSVRPDLAGQPEMVTRLRVRPDALDGVEICRLKGWELPIIVSKRVRSALLEAKVTGVSYTAV